MEKLFFMAGVNRAGATLLGSILNQNPDIYVNRTSPLTDLCIKTEKVLQELDQQYTFNFSEMRDDFLKQIPKTYFNRINKKYIIDNGRSWPGNVAEIKKYIDPNPKIICTYRPIPEVVTSFLALDKKDNDNALRYLLEQQKRPVTVENLADVCWNFGTKGTWEALRIGLQLYPEYILLINYHDLIENPKKQIDRVYEFLEIPHYEHHYENIVNTLNDPKDHAWGFRNLHNIRTDKVSKVSLDPKEVLGEELFEHYSKYDELLFEGINDNRLRR